MAEDLSSRQTHAFAVVNGAVGFVGQAIAPILVLALLSRGISLHAFKGAGIGIAISVPIALIAGWWNWSTTEYAVHGGALQMTSGLISHKHVSIPLARIEALDESEGPFARLVGVRAVTVQAAGGGKAPEIRLEALDAAAIDELRHAIGFRPVRRRRDPTGRSAGVPCSPGP